MTQAGRFGLCALLPELTLLAVALPSTLLFRVQSDNPDVIVIASERPFWRRMGNRSALQQVFTETPTVLLTADPGVGIVRSAGRMKIYSVLPMEVTTQQLVAAIAATVAGFVTLPRSPGGPANTMVITEDLTAREVEVLRLMARGYRNKQVATLLGDLRTYREVAVSSVLAKLGARTRTEKAVAIGVTRGLVAI